MKRNLLLFGTLLVCIILFSACGSQVAEESDMDSDEITDGIVSGGGEDSGDSGDSGDSICLQCWTQKSPMILPRMDHTSSTANGKIYVIGGYTFWGNTAMKSIEEFDPSTDTWTNCGTPAPGNGCSGLSTARGNHTASVVNGKIYVIGGDSSQTVEEYDPVSSIWTNCGSQAPGNNCQPLPVNLTNLSASVFDGKIYLIGGNENGMHEGSNTTIEYDPQQNLWVTRTDMPTPRSWTTSCVLEDKIWVIGGYETLWCDGDISGVMDVVELYDPIGDYWLNGTNLPYSASQIVCSKSNLTNSIILFGGRHQYDPLKRNEITKWNSISGEWNAQETMPKAISGHSVSTFNNKFYIFGGQIPSTGGNATNVVWQYDMSFME